MKLDAGQGGVYCIVRLDQEEPEQTHITTFSSESPGSLVYWVIYF
jgi:hypothetical protein